MEVRLINRLAMALIQWNSINTSIYLKACHSNQTEINKHMNRCKLTIYTEEISESHS